MNHFSGITPQERYQNELLAEVKRTNQLLEQLALLLKPQRKTRGS